MERLLTIGQSALKPGFDSGLVAIDASAARPEVAVAEATYFYILCSN
jgi:hypothetical protein